MRFIELIIDSKEKRSKWKVINQIIPALISFVVVAILSPLLIAVLRQSKLIQPIRKELPSDHQLKKGTPLMFGIILFVGIIVDRKSVV